MMVFEMGEFTSQNYMYIFIVCVFVFEQLSEKKTTGAWSGGTWHFRFCDDHRTGSALFVSGTGSVRRG